MTTHACPVLFLFRLLLLAGSCFVPPHFHQKHFPFLVAGYVFPHPPPFPLLFFQNGWRRCIPHHSIFFPLFCYCHDGRFLSGLYLFLRAGGGIIAFITGDWGENALISSFLRCRPDRINRTITAGSNSAVIASVEGCFLAGYMTVGLYDRWGTVALFAPNYFGRGLLNRGTVALFAPNNFGLMRVSQPGHSGTFCP